MSHEVQLSETHENAGIASSILYIIAMGMAYAIGETVLILFIVGQITFVAFGGGKQNIHLKKWCKKISSFMYEIQNFLTSSKRSEVRRSSTSKQTKSIFSAVESPSFSKAYQTPVGIGENLRIFVHVKYKECRRISDRQLNRFQPYRIFVKEIIANPRAIGAACPSSQYLARAMAAMIDDKDNRGIVVELGGGTGTVTGALLQQGIPPERIVTIERSPALAAHLRRKFPNIRVIEGDATQLRELLGGDSDDVEAVVSGLPLRSLPDSVVQVIMEQVRQLLCTGGIFIQFTYDLRTPSIERGLFRTHIKSKIVWKNVPPARVDAFSGVTIN